MVGAGVRPGSGTGGRRLLPGVASNFHHLFAPKARLGRPLAGLRLVWAALTRLPSPQSLSRCPVANRERLTIIPHGVPYMTKLLRYFMSEDSIFLQLEHVPGEGTSGLGHGLVHPRETPSTRRG